MISALATELLREGLDDWVPLRSVDSVVRKHLPRATDEEIRAAMLGLVEELLGADLVQIGSVSSTGFDAWAEPVAASLARVRSEFLSPRAHWEFAAWLSNTPAGDDVARGTEV